MKTASLPPTSTRVERATRPELNDLVRQRTDARIARLEGAGRAELDARIAKVEREWDIERVLQTNASILVLLGVILGYAVNRRFLLLPAGVLTFLAQHALQGWCPPIPVFRRHGVRTAREIAREHYAIKAMRGDFDRIPRRGSADAGTRVKAVITAVDA